MPKRKKFSRNTRIIPLTSKFISKTFLSWNELFEEIEDQLIEYEGKQIIEVVDEITDEEKKKKARVKNAVLTQPKLSFSIENKTLQIMHANIPNITIKFYFIDLEILFSRTPFIKQVSSLFYNF